MKTIENMNSNHTKKYIALGICLLLLFLPNMMFAQFKSGADAGALNDVSAIFKTAWTWARVILGVLCMVLIVQIATTVGTNGGETRSVGPKVIGLLIIAIIWVALPRIAVSMFGFAIE